MFKRKAVYIVAEIGQNHQGSFEMAKEMIREAKVKRKSIILQPISAFILKSPSLQNCGVDCVKFQKSNLEEKFTTSTLDRPYDSVNAFGATYGSHKRHLELSSAQMKALSDYAKLLKLDFGVSPMDPVSMKEMIELRPSFIKIGSGDANNLPMLMTAAESGLPVILSTGMQKQSAIDRAGEILADTRTDHAVLHCISSYPTDNQDVNLNQMVKLMEKYPVVGYSGHELGYSPSVAAVILGAKMIERHFTLDKTLKGSDHNCSLDPVDMNKFVQLVRAWEDSTIGLVCGNVQKCYKGIDFFPDIDEKYFNEFIQSVMGTTRTEEIFYCEKLCQDKLGKSLVYKRSLKSGCVLQEDHLSIKVSDIKGCSPEQYYEMVGQRLLCDVGKNEPIHKEHVIIVK